MSNLPRLLLKSGKEKPVIHGHPWVFSGAIDQVEDSCKAGDLVQVESAGGEVLGTGYFNSASQIAVRMLTRGKVVIDGASLAARILKAVELRKHWIDASTNAFRLVHSENDELPGLIVDRYGDFLSLQIQTAGMERWREVIIAALSKLPGVRGIYEKSESEYRKLEKLEAKQGLVFGEDPPAPLTIQENGISFLVELKSGQKTGFFLDQRDNRKMIGKMAQGQRVLNCFSYTGAFSVYAAKGGAVSTISVDSSEPALAMAKENFKLNGMSEPAHRIARTDVFQYLRQVKEDFDLIILDPPAFCGSKNEVDRASHAYKDINLFALKRVRAGGLLFTASCSSFISADLFQKIIFGAAHDAGREVKILQRTGHAPDHPIRLTFPEGEYLKGLLCVVD